MHNDPEQRQLAKRAIRSKLTEKMLDDLRRFEALAQPGPWSEDDGNVFSEPMQKLRREAIMRRLDGSDEPHPDDDREAPLGWVCTTHQKTETFELNCELIVAMRNALPILLDEIERLRKKESE